MLVGISVLSNLFTQVKRKNIHMYYTAWATLQLCQNIRRGLCDTYSKLFQKIPLNKKSDGLKDGVYEQVLCVYKIFWFCTLGETMSRSILSWGAFGKPSNILWKFERSSNITITYYDLKLICCFLFLWDFDELSNQTAIGILWFHQKLGRLVFSHVHNQDQACVRFSLILLWWPIFCPNKKEVLIKHTQVLTWPGFEPTVRGTAIQVSIWSNHWRLPTLPEVKPKV